MTDNIARGLAFKAKKLLKGSSILGKAATGATNGLTDTGKNFETNVLAGKPIKINHGGTEYVREITGNTSDTILFNDLEAPVNASAVIGSGLEAEGKIQITCIGDLSGAAGNDVSVVFVHGDTDTGERHASYDATSKVLTFTIDTTAMGVQQNVGAGDISGILLADGLNDKFLAPVSPESGDGEFVAGNLPITGIAVDCTGGDDGIAVSAGDSYTIPTLLDYGEYVGLVNDITALGASKEALIKEATAAAIADGDTVPFTDISDDSNTKKRTFADLKSDIEQALSVSFIVNDDTTGGIDKAASAEIVKTHGSKLSNLASVQNSKTYSHKHKALYICNTEYPSHYMNAIPQQFIGQGVLIEFTNWTQFTLNVNEWVNEFDLLIFHNDKESTVSLDCLSPVSAQEVVDALLYWKAAGNKIILLFAWTVLDRMKKLNADGSVAEIVTGFAGTLFPSLSISGGQSAANNGTFEATGEYDFGDDNIFYSDAPAWYPNGYARVTGHEENAEVIVQAVSTDGLTRHDMVVFKPNEYCAVGYGGIVYSSDSECAGYRYVNLGVLAKHLIGNTSPVRLSLDCLKSRKIAACGYDCDITAQRPAIEAIAKAWAGRPLELGIVTSRATSAEAEWYRHIMAQEMCSHSKYHFTAGSSGGLITYTDEAHTVGSDQLVRLKHPTRVSITSVKIGEGTLSSTGWKTSVDNTHYSHNGHGVLAFNADNIGASITVTYSALKEWDEWVYSLDDLKTLGLLTEKVVFLTAGINSISDIVYKHLKRNGVTICDYLEQIGRCQHILRNNTIPKMVAPYADKLGTLAGNWEQLIVSAGYRYSSADMEATYIPEHTNRLKNLNHPILFYCHDIPFSVDGAIGDGISRVWDNPNVDASWQKATYEDTIAYLSDALKWYLDYLDSEENVYWMTRSEYTRFYEYINEFVEYYAYADSNATYISVRNKGEKPVFGLTVRSTESIVSATLLPETTLTKTTYNGDDLVHFDLLAGETKTVKIAY